MEESSLRPQTKLLLPTTHEGLFVKYVFRWIIIIKLGHKNFMMEKFSTKTKIFFPQSLFYLSIYLSFENLFGISSIEVTSFHLSSSFCEKRKTRQKKYCRHMKKNVSLLQPFFHVSCIEMLSTSSIYNYFLASSSSCFWKQENQANEIL